MSQTRILHATIASPYAAAYDFTHRPENFPKWAAGLATTLRPTRDGWVADTAEGEARVRFSPPNAYGVLDHWVSLPGRPDIHIPLRILPNGDGVEVELVLFRQPYMSDADFERDAAMVEADLASLRRVLESEARRGD